MQHGEGVKVRATYLHKYQLPPFARTSEAMRELFGCHVSPGTLHTTQGLCPAELVGAEARIKAALRRADVIGADEAGLRVAKSQPLDTRRAAGQPDALSGRTRGGGGWRWRPSASSRPSRASASATGGWLTMGAGSPGTRSATFACCAS